jgi:hypothetical protein
MTIVVVSVAIAAVTLAFTIRRGLRRRRLHRALVKEAVSRLCAFQADEPVGVRRTHRDLARLIIAQEQEARVLDELVRPQVPDRPGKRNPLTGVLVAEAVAEEINQALQALRHTEPTLTEPTLAEPQPPEPAERAGAVRRARGQLGPVPRLADVAPLTDVLSAMRATLRSQVRQVHIVVRHAQQLELIGPECLERLRLSLSEVDAADRESEKLAAAGQEAAAAGVLAEVKMPVPQDGVPGDAARHDLDEQAIALAEAAAAYQDALVQWCLEALDRCGVSAATPQAGEAVR